MPTSTKNELPLEEILAYVAFDAEDRERLSGLHPRLAPSFPNIAALFYERARSQPRAAAMFSGPGQAARLNELLTEWMSTGLLGPHDAAFCAKRSRIGSQHVRIGLPQHYMFTAMSVIRSAYADHIARLYEPEQARLVVKSVDKLFDIELALMLRTYQLDSEAKLLVNERNGQTARMLAIQTLTAGLAHEVRNPLNSAKLQLELLERRLRREGSDPKLVEPVDLVHCELERLTHLLNEFLSFARPPQLGVGEHDIVAIAHNVIATERALAEARGAHLEIATSGPVSGRVDSAKVHQILQNLIRNAIEAVSPGGHVTVIVTGSSDSVRLVVEDDGPGISENVRQRIYEPFFSTKESGTGLGMSIVHSLVMAHEGSISIASPPQGTRFEVNLPYQNATAGNVHDPRPAHA
jgi:signal transduction histidine kinase